MSKIIQITATPFDLYGLDEDGDLYKLVAMKTENAWLYIATSPTFRKTAKMVADE